MNFLKSKIILMKTNRRTILKSTAATAVASSLLTAPKPANAQAPMKQANPKFSIKNGRIKQSIMGWTFNPMPTPEPVSYTHLTLPTRS